MYIYICFFNCDLNCTAIYHMEKLIEKSIINTQNCYYSMFACEGEQKKVKRSSETMLQVNKTKIKLNVWK